MTRYTVNATISFAAWIDVEADSPEEAMEEAAKAANMSASMFEYDPGTGEVDFNVTPAYEVAS